MQSLPLARTSHRNQKTSTGRSDDPPPKMDVELHTEFAYILKYKFPTIYLSLGICFSKNAEKIVLKTSRYFKYLKIQLIIFPGKAGGHKYSPLDSKIFFLACE